MKHGILPLGALAPCLCLAAAACDRQPGTVEDRPDNAATANRADAPSPAPANAADNDAAVTRSILRPDIAAPEAAPPPPEPVSATIAFGQSGLVLDDAGRRQVDALLARPVTRTGGPVILSGHSDTRGHDGDNLVVSRRRAEAVRDYLVEHGIAAERIRVIALGETRPIAPNAHPDGSDDPEGRARNRRVDIEIRPPADSAPARDTRPSTPD